MTQSPDRKNNRPSTRRRQERDSQLPPGRSVSRHPTSDPEPRLPPLEAALTGIDDGLFVLDKDWRCTYVNKAAATFLGSTPRESIGKVVWEALPHARDSRLYEEFVRAVEQKVVVRFEEYHEPFGRWYEWRCYPADGGLTVLLHDTTGHRLIEEAARARQEWEWTFDAVPDLITIIDPQHRILRANRAMAERLGTTPERCAGSLCYMCVHGLNAPLALCPHAQVLADGREHAAEIYEERLGGYFLITCTPLLDPQGRVLGSVHVARDITERKRAENAVHASEERYRRFFEEDVSGNFIATPQGNVVECNPVFAEIYGFADPGQAVGCDISRFNPADWTELVVRLRNECQVKGHRCVHRRPDGAEISVIANLFGWFDEAAELAEVRGYIFDETERRRAEDYLRRYQLLSDNSRDIILFMRRDDGRILEANAAALRAYGYSREELLARTVHDLRAPDTQEATAGQMVQADTRGILFETIHQRQDGSTFPVEVSSQGATVGDTRTLVSVIRDITKRRQAEEALRQLNEHLEEQVQARTQELRDSIDRLHGEVARRVDVESKLRERSQMLETFFQHTITPLVFMNWCFDFVRVNEAFAEAAGKDTAFFTGKNFFALYPDEEHKAVFERVVRTGQPCQAYAKPFRFAGDPQQDATHWNWWLTPLLDDHGQVESLVLNLEDVTERQKAFSELEERARQLQELTLELTQTEDRERKRLAEVLHDDLQQMLAAAKFHLGLLSSRVKTDATLQELAGQVKEMLQEAINKSRSLSHELRPPGLSHSDLYETFEWLTQQIQAKHGLTVHLDACERVELRSEPLKAFLYRAVQEMLFNVVKHARVAEAQLRLRRRRGCIYLSVSDRGQGFDVHRMGRAGGFGLLTIRERVRFLGGHMKVRSTPGKGSIFVIVVPEPQSAQEEELAIEQVALGSATWKERAKSPDNRALRVLLVDDHKIVRAGLESMLAEERDIEIVGQAGNGREAIDLARELQPDVVVMDVAMPVMGGDEATRQIKQHLPDTRVVALSMFDDDRIAERMRRAGAATYLLKTAPSEELLAAIRGT